MWAGSARGRAREAKGRGLKLMVPERPGSTAVRQAAPARTPGRSRAPHGRSDLGLEQGLPAAARKGTFLAGSFRVSVSITLTWWPALSYLTGRIKALWSGCFQPHPDIPADPKHVCPPVPPPHQWSLHQVLLIPRPLSLLRLHSVHLTVPSLNFLLPSTFLQHRNMLKSQKPIGKRTENKSTTYKVARMPFPINWWPVGMVFLRCIYTAYLLWTLLVAYLPYCSPLPSFFLIEP